MIWGIRELSGEMEKFCILSWRMVIRADPFTKTHQPVQLRAAYFSTGKLHPSNIPQKQTHTRINGDFRAFVHALPGVPFVWSISPPR